MTTIPVPEIKCASLFEVIKVHCMARGVTFEDLSKVCGFKSSTTLRRRIAEPYRFQYREMERIGKTLNVPLDTVFGWIKLYRVTKIRKRV